MNEVEGVNLCGRKLEDMENRLEQFNQWLRNENNAIGEDIFFTVGLDSDMILQDEYLRYPTCLEPSHLAAELPPGSSERDALSKAVLVASSAAVRTIGGWNHKAGLPKADELAISMGSVFLYQVPSGRKDDLIPALKALEENGVGIRKNEGFGVVYICDPFHWAHRGAF